MTAVQTLCSHVIRLVDGVIAGRGATSEQVCAYLESLQDAQDVSVGKNAQIGPNLDLRRCDFLPNPIASGDRQEFQIEIASQEPDLIRALVVLVYSASGQRVAILDLRSLGQLELQTNDSVRISGAIESLPLVEGDYHLGLYVQSNQATGNFMYLSGVTVVGGKSLDVVPYPPNDRGFIELSFASQLLPKVSELSLSTTMAERFSLLQ